MRERRLRFAVSLPERAVRATVGSLGGVVHESAQVLLPRVVRTSRLYEATAKNALRIAIEAVGGVEARTSAEIAADEVARRKAAGNVVEVGSIAEGAGFESVDDLLGAFEGASGRTARLLDLPPLELAELSATRPRADGGRRAPRAPRGLDRNRHGWTERLLASARRRRRQPSGGA